MNNIDSIGILIWTIFGLILGWITKSPFLYKWYKQWQKEKDDHQAFCNKVLEKFEENEKAGKRFKL